jgi:hypothetical protein
MKCTSKTRQQLGFISAFTVALLMMVGFSTEIVKANPFIVPDFGSATFTNPLDVDNPFLTLNPGTAFCYEADTEDGTEINEVTVVAKGQHACTIPIAGVQAIVVRDAVRLDGDLTEDTYDFYAQDDAGNVWYLGEATKECGPPPDTEGTWNANECAEDYCGGQPGIVMLANPMLGNSYPQEFLEGVAEDMAKVVNVNSSVSVPYGDFGGCLKTKEWTPLAPGDVEHKYYAVDILGNIGGNVLTEELKGSQTVLSELFDVLTDLSGHDTGYCPSDFEDALGRLCIESSPPPMNCEF